MTRKFTDGNGEHADILDILKQDMCLEAFIDPFRDKCMGSLADKLNAQGFRIKERLGKI